MAKNPKPGGGFNQYVKALRETKIPQPDEPEKRPIVFSFKYLDSTNKKFGAEHCQNAQAYLGCLLDRLRDVCGLTLTEFTTPSKALRNHGINFEGTSEKAGFPLPAERWGDRPFQFGVTANAHGRVHGFLITNIFYVVWFDPLHRLYPGQ